MYKKIFISLSFIFGIIFLIGSIITFTQKDNILKIGEKIAIQKASVIAIEKREILNQKFTVYEEMYEKTVKNKVGEFLVSKTAKEWAKKLNISDNAVENTTTKAFQKYDEAKDAYKQFQKIDLSPENIQNFIQANKSKEFKSDNKIIMVFASEVTSYYDKTLNNLFRDLRLFTFANFLLFICLLAIGLWKKEEKGMEKLLFVGTFTMIIAFIGSGLYIFNQNWAYNIVMGNYFAPTYVAVLVASILGICDIVFWEAKLTIALAELTSMGEFMSLDTALNVADIGLDIASSCNIE